MSPDTPELFPDIPDAVVAYFLDRQRQALETLAGGVAHEFNNLLAGIDGYSRIAREKLDDPAIVERSLNFCLQATQRGSELVNRLRHFTGGSPIDFETADLLPVIKDLVELHRPEIESDGIVIETHFGQLPPVRFDPGLFGIAFVDLVQNSRQALAHGEDRARLICFTTRIEDGEAVLRIQDSGRGMSTAELSQAITPFFSRAGLLGEGLDADRKGMGLPVARGIMKRLGGDLSIASTPDEGTNVRLSLPSVSSVPSAAPKRVLVVDDEPTIRRIFSLFLTRSGFAVVTAQNATEGLALLDAESFDIVILDQMMPRLSGTEMLEAMRAREKETATNAEPIRYPPVVMVTAAYSPDLARRAIELGAVACTSKPINRQKIIYLINNHTGIPDLAETSTRPDSAADSVAKSVLVIDADPLNREVLELVLRRSGYLPTTVGLSDEAESATLTEYYNLILVDIYMNDISGIDLVRRLRLNNPYTPILVTSPRLSRKSLNAALAAGATHAMQKPIDLQSLMAEIQRIDLLFRERLEK